MKKIVITAIITGLISGATFAQTVSSANVVGYVTQPSLGNEGFTIISLTQFKKNGVDSISIQNAVDNIAELTASTNFASADKLVTWNGSAYAQYGLWDATSNRWWMISGAGWVNPNPAIRKPTVATITRGTGIWLLSGAGASVANIVASGDVPTDITFDVVLPTTLSLIAYPFSSSINATNLVVMGATPSTDFASADKIVLWNGAYVQLGLFDNTVGNDFWMVSGAGWSNPNPAVRKPTSVNIDLGKGFWYQTLTPKTIRFTTNYSL
jgi:hypothetical protein